MHPDYSAKKLSPILKVISHHCWVEYSSLNQLLMMQFKFIIIQVSSIMHHMHMHLIIKAFVLCRRALGVQYKIGAKCGEVLLSNSLLLQIAQVYQVALDVPSIIITVTVLPVQQQDCGFCVIASATELCSGQDPTRAFFKQCEMRLHL